MSLLDAPSKRNQPALEDEKKKRTPASARSALPTAVDCGEGVPDSVGAKLGAAELVVEGLWDVAPGLAHERTTTAVRRAGRMGQMLVGSRSCLAVFFGRQTALRVYYFEVDPMHRILERDETNNRAAVIRHCIG